MTRTSLAVARYTYSKWHVPSFCPSLNYDAAVAVWLLAGDASSSPAAGRAFNLKKTRSSFLLRHSLQSTSSASRSGNDKCQFWAIIQNRASMWNDWDRKSCDVYAPVWNIRPFFSDNLLPPKKRLLRCWRRRRGRTIRQFPLLGIASQTIRKRRRSIKKVSTSTSNKWRYWHAGRRASFACKTDKAYTVCSENDCRALLYKLC